MKETDKKNIIISGYPKSGTHWLCRLTADLINAPLIGNWGTTATNQHTTEGLERVSEYACHKSHHTYEEIFTATGDTVHKILYVIRDPRDVVISAAYFFPIIPRWLKWLVEHVPLGDTIYSKIKWQLNKRISLSYKRKRMINTILNGDASVSSWFALSWKAHYSTFLNKDVLFVRYEDLQTRPVEESKRILAFLGLQRDEDTIKKTIRQQSFDQRKEEDYGDYKLMRRGESGYWKEEMTRQEQLRIKDALKKDLEYFSYISE